MFGGIKPKTDKIRTRYQKIENLPVPSAVILYTSQHIGAPSNPVVKKGDEVKKGEVIAEPVGGCSSYLHSSITGKIRAIKNIQKPGGCCTLGIIIEKQGDQNQIEQLEPLKNINPDTIRQRVKKCGIVGMGGAGFPTHIKLDPPKNIEIAFMNACECEPFLTSDERLIIEKARQVIEGFEMAKTAVYAEKGIVAIENDKPQAIDSIQKALKGRKDIELKILPKKYPQGYEKLVISESVGREVPSGGLPHDVGVSVHNVGTCYAVYQGVHHGIPLIERIVTVTGPGMVEPVNAKIPIGMKLKEILSFFQIDRLDEYEIFLGGPMMGFSIDSLDLGVMKTTSGIVIQRPYEIKEKECIRCGKCVEVCPVGLVPQELNKLYDMQDFGKMMDIGLSDCMECGCCTYTCPSKINITYKIKTAKTKI
ncbi:MAG: electron transport complex subunit RsxC [Elusimicrobiota bacterium]